MFVLRRFMLNNQRIMKQVKREEVEEDEWEKREEGYDDVNETELLMQ